MRASLVCILTVLILLDITHAATVFSLIDLPSVLTFQKSNKNRMDISQASLMLTFLANDTFEQADSVFLNKIMQSKGTELIIQQMNFARKVSPIQYRRLLSGLHANNFIPIQPLDATERARRGVEGLVNNVWPLLQWGKQNTSLLWQKLNELKELDVYEEAQKIAKKYLPHDVQITPSIYVVIGGRAGFAAFPDNNLYFDLLVMTFSRIKKGLPQISRSEITEFFAHEMHHLGLSRILAEKQKSLTMNLQEKLIFSFLSSLVSEGSATYLINGHRDIKSISDNPSYSEYFKEINNLLRTCESILTSIVTGKINTETEFDAATASLLGHSYHSAGSYMLSIIDQTNGLEPIMKILDDPRLLISIYNKSATQLNQVTNSVYTFKSALADRITGVEK